MYLIVHKYNPKQKHPQFKKSEIESEAPYFFHICDRILENRPFRHKN